MNAPTAAQQLRIDRQLHLLSTLRASSGQVRPSWFGHLRIASEIRETDVLLGASSHTAGSTPVVDWQTAPIAEVFFTCEEGDEYELDVGERLLAGKVLERNLVEFQAGELVRIHAPEGVLVRRPDGAWALDPNRSSPRIEPRAPQARLPFRSPLDVELDPVQQRVVDLPADRSVLLLGEAGFGKTTVALHRLLALREKGGPGFRGAVVVPTDGLRRLTELMLERREISGIEVWTFDRWVAVEGRKAFRGLPARESVNTPASVIRLKRDPALRSILAEFLKTRPRKPKPRSDLEHLFGDRAWMERVVSPSVAAEVAEHTRIQFCSTTEAEYAHVDAENLVTVDARRIDEGTPMEDANSLDVEDFAVLFELDRLRALRDGKAPAEVGAFDCVVLDEAQEFAPIELALIGRAVAPGGTLIVAGDAAQQVDPTGHFSGWTSVLEELGIPEAEQAVLQQNYRCPPEVTALARSAGRTRVESGGTDGAPAILWAAQSSRFHQAVWLCEEVRRISTEDPGASIALICRSAEAARSWARALRHGPSLHLALGGDFRFRPGLVVTCVPEVKGLEFDYVILPDASAATYPATEDARRGLYVALTRASHRLVLGSDGPWSPLLGHKASST